MPASGRNGQPGGRSETSTETGRPPEPPAREPTSPFGPTQPIRTQSGADRGAPSALDPLIGREGELSIIRHSLNGSGNHCGVVIAGAAGVGKTRLAREALALAQSAGERTNWIVGTESARTLPLGAFATAVSGTLADPLPSTRDVIKSFAAQQHRNRMVIGVDDAHLLDALSAHVVHQLALSRSARLIVTVRTGCAEPDAVTALWKDGLLDRVDLQPLAAPAVRRMVETTLGGAVDTRTAERFTALTGGNPLFLRQLLQDQLAGNRLKQVAGVWLWDDRCAVSPNIGDIIGRQLGGLSPGVALVLDTLSQCEPLPVDVLTDLVRRADLELAEQLHLVTVERSGGRLSARLAHPLYGELRNAAAGELRLSRIRGRLAQRLAGEPDADMHATVRRALLTLESDLPADPQLFGRAARFAMTLLDLDLADRFADAAMRAGAPEAASLRAMNLVLLGRGDDAEAVLQQMCRPGRPDRQHWETVRAANLTWTLGRPQDAAAILDGLAGGPESPAERAERAAVQACVDVVLARCDSAIANARQALKSPALPDFHAMMAALALVMALGALGRVDGIADIVDDALRRAMTSFQSAHLRFWLGSVYARACRLTGRIAECVTSAEQFADSATDVPGLAYANLAFLLGHAELVRGEIPAAIKLLREALAGAEKYRVTTGLRAACSFALAEAHAKLGEAAAAKEALAEARGFVPDDYLFMQTALSLVTGWTLAADGALGEAVAAVRAAAGDARDRDQPTHELACLQAAAQWGDATAAARARELAGELSLPLAEAVARHAESLRDGDGDGLLTAAAEYRAIGDVAAAAAAAAQASAAFIRAEHHNRGTYAAALARELADACGGLCTPALHSAAAARLTGREREVAELVVAGLSNRDIAEKLVMSVRTVEAHVYRACRRVGANSRSDLAAILRAGPRPNPIR